MRTHHPGKAPAADQPSRATPAPRVNGAGKDTVALQRSIGHAAVSRMLEQARHQHGAGGGRQQAAPAPAQRSAVHDVLIGSGQPLGASLKEEMEARLGADFSDVRVHTDDAARASAAGVGARAYTSGSHVVIGDGGADKHTLAHELTHVIQQRQGPVAGTDHGNGLKLSDPSDHDEKAAEVNAARAMRAPLSQHRLTAAGSSTHGGTDESGSQVVPVLDGTAGRFQKRAPIRRLRLAGAASPAVMQHMHGAERTLPGPVIQRAPADAAAALHTAGYVQLTKKQFSDWLKEKPGKGPAAQKNAEIHGVNVNDLAAVSQLLGELKEQAVADYRIAAARAKLATAQGEAPGVHIDHEGVSVDLDTDQLKHQPEGAAYAIGTRRARGGARWPASLEPNADWHEKNTLPVIGDWAADQRLHDGDVVSTKQSVPLRDGNYYEGFCVQVDGQKYVFFHCYPGR